MKFEIKHELPGRIRIHLRQTKMTIREADLFSFYLSSLPMVKKAVVYERTADAAIVFDGSRQELIDHILQFRYEDRTLDEIVPQESGRALNQEYKEKLLQKLAVRAFTTVFFPAPLRAVYTLLQSLKYLAKGIRCLAERKLEVEVLDATAISVSMLRMDFNTAGSVMFLL